MNSSNKLRSLTSEISESIPLIGCKNQAAGAKYARFGQGAKTCLNKYVPITVWLPNYSFDSLLRDIIAGLTVGLMVVPQALAYATVANLPLRCGLHSAYLGCFVYCIFGGCKDVSIGPTAITSLTVSQFDRGEPLYATTLALCGGTVQYLLGVLRLGFLVRFISVPVISGFVLAAAITIGFGRVKNLLGLKHVPRDFIPNVINTFRHIKETNPWDFLLGFCCILLLFFLKKINHIKWKEDEYVTTLQRACRKFLWLLSTARNALVVVLAASIVRARESL